MVNEKLLKLYNSFILFRLIHRVGIAYISENVLARCVRPYVKTLILPSDQLVRLLDEFLHESYQHSFYLADIPRPTETVKRICYADDITVCESGGGKIPELEHKVNTYLTEMSCYLWVNALLISAPKSSVSLCRSDPAQTNTHPKVKIDDSEIPLVRSPKILGVYLDTFFSLNTHYVQVANRVSKRNNVWKQLSATDWGHQNETLLMTYKALGRSIANYAAPVWSTNTSESNMDKIQNESLRIVTCSHNMSSIDHLYSETEMQHV